MKTTKKRPSGKGPALLNSLSFYKSNYTTNILPDQTHFLVAAMHLCDEAIKKKDGLSAKAYLSIIKKIHTNNKDQ